MSQKSVFYIVHRNDEWQALPEEEYDPENIYHVSPHEEGWAVEKEWSLRPSSVHDTKQPAVERGKELASSRNGRLVIHKKSGEVQNELDFGEKELAAAS